MASCCGCGRVGRWCPHRIGAGSPRASPRPSRVTCTSTGRDPTVCDRSCPGARSGTTATGLRSSIPSSGWSRLWGSRGALGEEGHPRSCTSSRSFESRSWCCGAAATSSCGGYGWRWWGARRQAWWAGPGTGSEWRAGAGRRRMGWWCSPRTPPRTPGRASWPRHRFAPPPHSGWAPTPAGRRSQSWGDPSTGRGSRLRRTASRDEGGPSLGTSTTPRCARRSSPRRAGRSRNSRGSLRRRWIRATAVSTYRCGMCATTHPGRAPTAGRPCRSGSADALRLGGAMSHPSPPADLLDDVVRALTPAFRLDQRVAATPERAVYHAWDRVLKRSVALHVHLAPDSPGRAWFLRETETLAALDHPAIRHVYAAGVGGTFAYRTANWVEGESLAEALRRGPRPIRTAHALVRDLLGAAEHAHARGVILRRIVPLTLMLELTGRAVITDLRYCNWCLPNVPPEEQGAGGAFVAPEVRTGSPGEPRSDVYGVAALVYYVLTGQEPDLDPARITPPRQLRPAVPAALERVLLRALQFAPGDRYYTATEMLEDFVSDAGVFQEPAAAPQVAEAGFERRLRRALGDDYELLEEIGTGGFGRVYRALDQALSALEHAHPLGLVHRDLKPENMLIEPDGRLRITDFGLALALRGDARWGGATSRSGTPQFAAPEQLLGERVDQRADLYSLAATAYFALLGRPPFEGPTPEAILARQTTEDPPSLHESRKDVPRELEDVLRKALASEPAARYPTATAFRDAPPRSRGLLFRLRALLWGK